MASDKIPVLVNISADQVVEFLKERGTLVEVVRCRECRWGHLCMIGQHLGLDGFCSKGEREVQE